MHLKPAFRTTARRKRLYIRENKEVHHERKILRNLEPGFDLLLPGGPCYQAPVEAQRRVIIVRRRSTGRSARGWVIAQTALIITVVTVTTCLTIRQGL